MNERKAIPLALLGLALLLFAPFWLGGRVFVPGDFPNFVYPWRAQGPPQVHNLDLLDVAVLFYPQDVFLNECLKKGDLPLWNPRIFCGHPMVASGQSALLYPPRLLAHRWLPPAPAKTILLMLHMAGMGLAMYGWLLGRGLSPRAAGFGGLCWMLNSFVTGWMELDVVVYMGLYVPLMLWAFDARRWPELAVLGALCLHAGHLQVAFYMGLILIVHAAQSILLKRNWKLIPGLVASGLGVALLAAPTVAPSLELLSQSQRATFTFERLQDMSTGLGGMLLSLLNPDFLGNPSRGFALNRSLANLPYYEFAAYFGLVPLALSVLAVVRAPRAAELAGGDETRARELRLWGAWAALALLFATATPLYRLVVLLLPFMKQAIPGRFILIFVFAGCLLASHGFEVWCRDERARREVALALLPVSGLTALFQVGLAGWLWGRPEAALAWLDAHRDGRLIKVPPYHDSPAYLHEWLGGLQANYLLNPNIAMTVLAGLLAWWLVRRPRARLLAGLVALDLLLFAQHFNTTVPVSRLGQVTPALLFLQQQASQPGRPFRVEKESAAFSNLLTVYGLNLVTGYESVFPRRFAETIRRAQPDRTITMRTVALTHFDSPILAAMNLGFLLQAPLDLKPPAGWEKVWEGSDGRVFYNPRALPRVFVRGLVKPFRTFEQALDYLGSRHFDPAREVVAEELPPGPLLAAANGARAEIRLYEPDRVELTAELPGPGILVLADTFYRGWACRDAHGVEHRIFPVNGSSRGVYLGAGTHHLVFLFEPPSYWLGLRLAGIGALLVLLAVAARERGKGKGSR